MSISHMKSNSLVGNFPNTVAVSLCYAKYTTKHICSQRSMRAWKYSRHHIVHRFGDSYQSVKLLTKLKPRLYVAGRRFLIGSTESERWSSSMCECTWSAFQKTQIILGATMIVPNYLKHRFKPAQRARCFANCNMLFFEMYFFYQNRETDRSPGYLFKSNSVL